MIISLFLVIATLFATGFVGILTGKSNLVFVVISLEILALALVLWFLMIGWVNYGDLKSIVFGILMLVVGASESSVGLALAISLYKFQQK